MKNIVISGKAAAGKDTIANELVSKYGYHKTGISDSLKQFCSHKYAYPLEWNYTQEGKNKYLKITQPDGRVFFHGKVRDLLIEVGKQGRIEHKDYWLDRMIINEPAVVVDVRFENEAEYFKKKGYLLVRLNATAKNRFKRHGNYELAYSKDESETELDDYEGFDLVLDNDDEEDIQKVVQEIRERI